MGIATGVRALSHAIFGRPARLPADFVACFPELSLARWRRGGLPVRVGGWCLGQKSVSAITLWNTIWIAPDVEPSCELLLHEFRHVQQFASTATFPLAYLWQSVSRGYLQNRFEVDARAYAARRVRESLRVDQLPFP